MRIVAGALRGKKLVALRGTDTRPTADRIRESIFNILGTRVRETVVLDLFAGTGALSLEALSRGAGHATLLENNKQAMETIQRNIEACGFQTKTDLLKWDISRGLHCIRVHQPPFDLVFMDPPYGKGFIRPALEALHRAGGLAARALVIIEHGNAERLTRLPEFFEISDQRRYGKTLVCFASYVI
jgi:16S rRNA (guanine966-N2)-methyltransferase